MQKARLRRGRRHISSSVKQNTTANRVFRVLSHLMMGSKQLKFPTRKQYCHSL
jgi:hypothetical protein